MELFTKVGRRYCVAETAQVLAWARQCSIAQFNVEKPMLASPAASRDFLRNAVRGLEHEVFGIIFLDSRHRVIKYAELFRGTVDGSSVHPREVVKEALRVNASAVILAHNHPSGIAEPSQADEIITSRLRDALALVEIRTLDHLIVGGETVTSLAERGLV